MEMVLLYQSRAAGAESRSKLPEMQLAALEVSAHLFFLLGLSMDQIIIRPKVTGILV